MLLLKCLTKVFTSKFYFITGLENDEKLVTWSSKSTKLLISLRREKTDLFDHGKVRRKVAWDKVAELFNANSSVRVTGEQCSNKWKKLEEKYKKVREHNAKTGSDKKECEFEDELAEFFRVTQKLFPRPLFPCCLQQVQALNPRMKTRNYPWQKRFQRKKGNESRSRRQRR